FPDLVIGARHPDYVSAPGEVVGENAKTTRQLTNLTHVIKLARGYEVAGIVLGPDDKPFPGAKVKAGRRWSDSNRDTTSGADGRFRLLNVKGELQAVTATADGYAAATKAVTPGTNVIELTLKLNQGGLLKGLVLDPDGQPVPQVQVSYDPQNVDYEWTQRNNVDWDGNTDEQGHFEWKSAPEGELEFSFFKEGFASRRGVKLKVGTEENVVRLSRPRKVLGVVGDYGTSQPIAQFSVWPAEGTAAGFNSWSDSDKRQFNDPEGHFTLEIPDESKNIIKVEASDHLPKFVVLPAPQGDYVTVTVLLEVNPAEEGIVVDAAGQPLAEVAVGVVGRNWNAGIQIGRGRLSSGGNLENTTRSDAQGHFRLPGVPEPQSIVAISPVGFGEVSWEEFLQTKRVVLLPFGRIEGTLAIAGKPAEGKTMTLSLSIPGPSQLNADWKAFQTETDQDGRFVLEQVPPGERFLSRMIMLSPTSSMQSHRQTVTVLPGQTTTLTLGNTGAVITGRLNFAALTAGHANISLSGGLSTPFPQPPVPLKTAEEALAWRQLPETMAAMRAFQSYGVTVQPDGSFIADGVGPGTYTLNLNATEPKPEGKQWERISLGHVAQTVTVGDEAATALVPMSLGEITLLPPDPVPPTGPGN
ncbi:MAG TPA: carboxypeptidase regulatory-like domain-containing protein, partial [Candidatus Limnocylindria bacterium]|nr:carboxypeptidase regulatory-like domain-containing protein [Candidatus Limnocylindria bacterium]